MSGACLLAFTEQFVAGLTPYTQTAGSTSRYGVAADAYGNALSSFPGSPNPATYFNRPISGGSLCRVTSLFRINSLNSDDGMTWSIGVSDNVGTLLYFNPCREASFDAARRPQISGTPIPTTLSVGVWYELDITLAVSPRLATATIRTYPAGTLVASATHPTVIGLQDISHLNFGIDANANVSGTTYSNFNFYTLADVAEGAGASAGSATVSGFGAAAARGAAGGQAYVEGYSNFAPPLVNYRTTYMFDLASRRIGTKDLPS